MGTKTSYPTQQYKTLELKKAPKMMAYIHPLHKQFYNAIEISLFSIRPVKISTNFMTEIMPTLPKNK